MRFEKFECEHCGAVSKFLVSEYSRLVEFSCMSCRRISGGGLNDFGGFLEISKKTNKKGFTEKSVNP